MSIYDIFTLLGGVAMFLFGMRVMGESLEKRAGSKLKPILENLTSHPWKAVLLGAGVTAIMQSSSGTTVMVVGFVNSGIMQLRQAIAVVMGANIGTTITAWFLSLVGVQSSNFLITLLKPSTFSPILGFVGIVLLMSGKRHKDTAGILLGFAVLMLGMQQMSGAVSSLSDNAAFIGLLTKFSNPFIGVLVGAAVAGIIQSSSASVGILQAISLTGGLSYGAALPIIMGQNIGTCVTSIVSAIGANRNAKRVAAAHVIFNVLGTILFLGLFYLSNALFRFSFVKETINPFGVALVHSLFNLGATALFYPLIPLLESAAKRLIPDGQGDELAVLLDERLLKTPPIAIEVCRRQVMIMADQSKQAQLKSDALLDAFDSKEFDLLLGIEELVDRHEDMLGSYLIKVSAQPLSQAQSLEAFGLLHMISDLERISDHAVNLGEAAQEMSSRGWAFSARSQEDLAVIRRAVRDVLELTVDAVHNNDITLAQRVEPLEEVVNTLAETIRSGHILRMQEGESTFEVGLVLSEILINLERISDHCSNLALSMIEMKRSGSIDAHAYTRALREGESGRRFKQQYEEYLKRYALGRQD